jgi:predicted glycosyltransferase
MSTPLKVLVYVQHLLGVGHVKRAAAITRAMVAAGLDVHVVLGGEPVPHADFATATLHQLPSARANDMSFSLLLDAHNRPVDEAWRAARKSQLLALEADIKPQVIITEHFPFGRAKFAFELIPMFEQARARGNVKILASVRDVLVEKADDGKASRMLGWIDTWFDHILVHGDEAVIPFDATFPGARAIRDKLVYTGYVVDQAPPVAGASATDGTNEIIVSIGGGAVGENLLRVAIGAAEAVPGHSWRLLVGANLSDQTFAAVRAEAATQPHVIVERARPDFRALLSRAALSISQGGYNTLMDVLVARCPAVIVPFAGGAESEQTFRAEEFARRGLISVIAEASLTPPALAAAAQARLLHRHSGTAPAINLDGAAGTARHVMALAGLA